MPRRAQLGVDAPVHELQELDGELDVADAAGAALHVAIAVAARPTSVLGAHLEGAHVAQVVGAERARPTARGRRAAAHAAPSVAVAGDRHAP